MKNIWKSLKSTRHENGILRKHGPSWLVKETESGDEYMLHPDDIDENALKYEPRDLGGSRNLFNVVGKAVKFNLVEYGPKSITFAKLI